MIPFYWLIKCVFHVWLMADTDGSQIIYQKLIRPYFLLNEGQIDGFWDKAKKFGGDVIKKVTLNGGN
jgi:receptor expression-enhancing protein 5/6